jgi:hypothetical protein
LGFQGVGIGRGGSQHACCRCHVVKQTLSVPLCSAASDGDSGGKSDGNVEHDDFWLDQQPEGAPGALVPP